jgi:hypothetical protein
LAFLGLNLGQNWTIIEPVFRKVQYALITLFVILIAVFFWKKFKRR